MTDGISPNVVIMTRDEMQVAVTKSFHRGVERGKFEESCARSNTPAQGSAGHTEATENTGPASPDAAVRLTNSSEPSKGTALMMIFEGRRYEIVSASDRRVMAKYIDDVLEREVTAARRVFVS